MDRPVCHKLSLKAFLICNKAGVNLKKTSFFKTTVHRRRFKKIEELGDKIRQYVMNTMKRKMVCLSF
jgi:hypothetical protein